MLADPDDDGARLVLADWLLEQGDPRGELIQIQCALAGAGGSQGLASLTRDELVAREKALLKKHQTSWLAPIRSFVRTWTWRRGFVDGVVADAKAFLAGVDTIFSTTPLTHATWTALKPPLLDALARAIPAGRLRSLDLGQQRISPEAARAFGSERFAGLRRLDVWGNPLGDEGAAALVAAHLDDLEELELATCKLTAAGVEALSRAAFFPRLRRLGLRYNDGLGPGVAAALVRATSLQSLALGRAGIGDDGLEVLAGSPSMKQLRDVDLFGNAIGPRGVHALVSSPHLTALTTVTGLVGYGGGFEPDSAEGRALKNRFGEGLR